MLDLITYTLPKFTVSQLVVVLQSWCPACDVKSLTWFGYNITLTWPNWSTVNTQSYPCSTAYQARFVSSWVFWLSYVFCPRVPVQKNRYKTPNNVQQLNKGRKEWSTMVIPPVYRYTRTQPNFVSPKKKKKRKGSMPHSIQTRLICQRSVPKRYAYM